MGTTSQIKEVLSKSEEMFRTDSQVSSFEQSLKEFNKMIADGFAKPRGYNIRTVDGGIMTFQFNK